MNRLLLFAKYPEPGLVKTRLAAEVGPETAARLYRDMVEEVVRVTQPSAKEYERVLYIDPPEKREAFQGWFPELALAVQRGDDLGERLAHACEESLRACNRVAIIGTDCIELDAALIGQAFASLAENDLVIGPARDGGYYLIACKKMHRELFTGIPWSTERVLEETCTRANDLGLTVHQLPLLSDYDEITQ